MHSKNFLFYVNYIYWLMIWGGENSSEWQCAARGKGDLKGLQYGGGTNFWSENDTRVIFEIQYTQQPVISTYNPTEVNYTS
jgi:hypothetical protein